jgi:hypothetical protein
MSIERPLLPVFQPQLGELETIAQCELLATFVFWEIADKHTSLEARRIFAAVCGKPPTRREEQLNSNAELLWQYLKMPRRNIHQLATRIAKETGDDPRALEKKIERAVKSKKVRGYLERTLIEVWPVEGGAKTRIE